MPPLNHDEQQGEEVGLIKQSIYEDSVYCELEYQRHVKHLQDLDAERDQHQRRTQDVAFARNTHLRINGLPVEVLSLIFHRMREPRWSDKPDDIEKYPFKQKTRKWVVVTWVCRHWRNVALNDPTLWTIIPYRWSLWTPEILMRAGSMGLKVDLGPSMSWDLQTVGFVLQQSQHISHLKLSTMTMLHIGKHGSKIGATPKLQSLSISKYKRNPRADVLLENIDLPTNIFDDCKTLQYLEVDGMHILQLALSNIPSIFHSSIRQLRLSHCSFQKIECVKPALVRITSLESLLLYKTLSRQPVPPSGAPVPLGRVDNLDLDEDPAQLIWFFDNFFFRSRPLRARISTRLDPQSSKDLLPLLTALAHPDSLGNTVSSAYCVTFEMKRDVRYPEYNRALSALVLKASHTSKTLTAEGAVPDIARFDIENGYDLSMQFAQKWQAPSDRLFEPSPDTFHSMFTRIYTHFQWNSLHELALVDLKDGRTGFSPTEFGMTLRDTFGKLPNIRNILVDSANASALIDALWIDHKRWRENQDSTQVAFPGLLELYLEFVCVDREHGQGCRRDRRVDVDRFLSCLQGRLECGLPIQRLSFFGCTGSIGDHLDAFEKLVPKVEWDKFGVNSESSNEDSGKDEEYEDDGVPTEQYYSEASTEDEDSDF